VNREAKFFFLVQAIGFVWGVLMVLTYFLGKNPVYVEAIGYASVLIEVRK